jgi:hypothetical protein
VENIQDIISNPGETKKLKLKIKNIRAMFLQDCQVSGSGKNANWFSQSEIRGLAGGESWIFSFNLDIPESIESGIYNLSVDVVCEGFNKTVDFILEVIGKKLVFDLIEVKRDSRDFVKVVYSLEEASNLEQNVELQFLLFNSNNKQITEIKENKIISPSSKQEFEILIPIDPLLEGEFNLLVNLNSETYSSFIQENIILSSLASGFSIFGENEIKIDNLSTGLLILVFLIFAFFIIRKILKHKKRIKR